MSTRHYPEQYFEIVATRQRRRVSSCVLYGDTVIVNLSVSTTQPSIPWCVPAHAFPRREHVEIVQPALAQEVQMIRRQQLDCTSAPPTIVKNITSTRTPSSTYSYNSRRNCPPPFLHLRAHVIRCRYRNGRYTTAVHAAPVNVIEGAEQRYTYKNSKSYFMYCKPSSAHCQQSAKNGQIFGIPRIMQGNSFSTQHK